MLLGPFGPAGCYYGHLASGQLKILWRREPIEEAIRDDRHPDEVRALLSLTLEVREFAKTLGLTVDGQYTSYVNWPGDRIVTTLVRTRAGSLDAVPWRYPFLGQLPYRGYFDRERAEREAEQLLRDGRYDVCVSGVTAYSTLGWLDDPVTRPMLARGAPSLVETLLHELVHATAFLPGEADFNESAAQFIGQQAAIRFFEQEGLRSHAPSALTLPSADHVRNAIDDRRRIAEVQLAFRHELEALTGRPDREALRTAAEARTRETLAALPLAVLDARGVAERARLSDACLALRGTYIADLARHERVYLALQEELPRMIERLRLWADEERPPERFFDVSDLEADSGRH